MIRLKKYIIIDMMKFSPASFLSSPSLSSWFSPHPVPDPWGPPPHHIQQQQQKHCDRFQNLHHLHHPDSPAPSNSNLVMSWLNLWPLFEDLRLLNSVCPTDHTPFYFRQFPYPSPPTFNWISQRIRDLISRIVAKVTKATTLMHSTNVQPTPLILTWLLPRDTLELNPTLAVVGYLNRVWIVCTHYMYIYI